MHTHTVTVHFYVMILWSPEAAPFVFFRAFHRDCAEDIYLCPRPQLHENPLLLLSSGFTDILSVSYRFGLVVCKFCFPRSVCLFVFVLEQLNNKRILDPIKFWIWSRKIREIFCWWWKCAAHDIWYPTKLFGQMTIRSICCFPPSFSFVFGGGVSLWAQKTFPTDSSLTNPKCIRELMRVRRRPFLHLRAKHRTHKGRKLPNYLKAAAQWIVILSDQWCFHPDSPSQDLIHSRELILVLCSNNIHLLLFHLFLYQCQWRSFLKVKAKT